MDAKKFLILTVSILLVSGAVLAGQTIIQKGSVITDVFNATSLFVEKTSGYQLKGSIDAAGNKVINLAEPSDEQDAATKAYVDEVAKTAKAYINVPSCASLGYTTDTKGLFACGNKGCAKVSGERKTCCFSEKTIPLQPSGNVKCKVSIGDNKMHVFSGVVADFPSHSGCIGEDYISRSLNDSSLLIGEASCYDVVTHYYFGTVGSTDAKGVIKDGRIIYNECSGSVVGFSADTSCSCYLCQE
jgi:hypothetical protein